MGERAGLLANWITASKDLKGEQAEKHTKHDIMVVRGDELLLISLFLKIDTTLKATVNLFLLLFTIFFDPSLMGSLLRYIISFSTISTVHLLII